MINYKLIKQFKDMTTKELKDYTKSLANRIIAQIDLGAISSDGTVVFSDGVAWVLDQPKRKQTQADRDAFAKRAEGVDLDDTDALMALVLGN